MRNRFYLHQPNDVSLILMKNIREELAEIPLQYIKEVRYDMSTFPTLRIEIPSRVKHHNKWVNLEVFNQIRGKMVLILSINGHKQKFIIDENFTEKRTKNGKVKDMTAYGYEKTLEKKTFLIGEGATRQLYRPEGEEVEVSDGILNWFEQQNPYWKVGYVDELARKELMIYNKTEEIELSRNFVNNKVQLNGVIWEQYIQVEAGRTFSITYDKMSSYLNNQLQKTENITHSFTLNKNLRKITAVYTSSADYLFGVDYTFLYSDKTTETVRVGFTNVKNMKIVIEYLYATVQMNETEEKLTTRYRFFEQCSTTWYSFLKNEVSEAYQCVFEFDSYNQVLNCYHKDNYGNDSGLYMSYENGIKEINKTHRIGEVISRLYVESSNVSISESNKLGTEYVECYDYYIREGLMSSELQESLKRYDKYLDDKQIEWLQIKLDKNKTDQQLTVKNTELVSLQERYKAETAILSALIKACNNSTEQKEQSQLVEQLDKEIQAKLNEVQSLKDKSSDLLKQMMDIGQQISKEVATDTQGKIFTDMDLQELEEFTVEGSIQDDYYLTSEGLYNYALKTVKEMNDVLIDFTIDTENLLKRIVHPEGWQRVLGLGEKIWVDEMDLTDGEEFIQLTAFSYSPANGGSITSLTFTNNKESKSSLRTISDIGRQATQTSNMTNFWKDTWKQAQNNNVHVEKLLQEGLDAAAMAVRARSTINKIDITEAGIFIIDALNENNQICLMSSMIAITQNRWKTSELAVSAEGVLANSVVGKLIMSDKLLIGNEDNTFVINPNGLSVYDQDSLQTERIFLGLEKVNGVKKARLRLHSAKGDKKLVLSEDGMYNVISVHAMDNFDKNNALECAFYLGDNIQSIHDFNLRVKLGKFRAYSKTSQSGGGVSTTKTSKSSGSFSVSSSTNMGGYKKQTSGTMIAVGETVLTQPPKSQYQSFNESSYKQHIHEILPTQFEHKHEFVIPDHDHSFTVNQGGHTHTVDITIDAHTHEMTYGIYQNSASPTVNIYLNSTLIASNVTASATYDITTQAKGLGKGWHTIKVVGVSKTGNTEGLGRASIDASIGAFVSF